MENRNFTRVDFSGCASISHGDDIVWGNVNNVSLQGFHILTSQDLPLNIPLEITIHNSPDSSIHLRASAVHCEKTGAGMKISDFDVNSFVQLRDVISLSCDDPWLVMSETYKMLHCIH
jgi:hypothetical protein